MLGETEEDARNAMTVAQAFICRAANISLSPGGQTTGAAVCDCSIFIYQFFTFYLFGTSDGQICIKNFMITWAGQIVFGGGLEEGGWRGYLQPALERKVPVIVSVILVGIVWAAWHLPYFFLLCTLFHGWQNAIVMTIPPNMGHPSFLMIFLMQTVISIIICVKCGKSDHATLM